MNPETNCTNSRLAKQKRFSEARHPMLCIQSVTKHYGALTALDGVSLDIARGEFFGLLGPNGAGKSTLMALVAGLRAPDAGTMKLDGVPLSASDVAVRASLGFVPQSIAFTKISVPNKICESSANFMGCWSRAARAH
ncbi:MAG: ATP-binding cassette domain-containing protein [Verrucomicrobiota bacterium]